MHDIKKITQLTGHTGAIYAITPAESPNQIFSAGGDGWIVHWDLENPDTGKLVAKTEVGIFSLLYIPEINTIIAGDLNGGVHWIPLTQPQLAKHIGHHRKGVFDIQKIGDSIFTIGGDGFITKWSLDQQRSIESLQLSGQSLRSLDFNPETGALTIGASDGYIYILDIRLNLIAKFQNAHAKSVFTVRHSPQLPQLWSGGRDAILKIWQEKTDTLDLISTQPAHLYTINHIAFHPNGSLAATASRDRTIKIWDTQTGELLKVLNAARNGGHLNSVNRLLWLQYKNYLISASDDRTMIVWQPNSERYSQPQINGVFTDI